MKHIIVDADDTILAYTDSLLSYANVEHPKNAVYTDICDFLTKEHNYTFEEVQDLIVDFNNSVSFRNIEPFKGSEKVIRKLSDDGVKMHVVTSCGDNGRIKTNRYHNLREVFGDVFDKIHILPLMSRKINTLLSYVNEDVVFIEDTLAHYNDAHLLGIDSYIIKGAMNSLAHNEKIQTFDHWEDFYNLYYNNHK